MRLFIQLKRKQIVSILLIIVTTSAVAQVQKPAVVDTLLNLQECLEIGLVNNFDLQIVRNEELISDNNVTLGNAGFLPDASLNSGYNIRSNNSNQFPMEGGDAVETRNSNTQTLDAGVNLNWTIFEGFRVQTNYKRLKELQSVGELYTRLEVEDLVAGLTAEYYKIGRASCRERV